MCGVCVYVVMCTLCGGRCRRRRIESASENTTNAKIRSRKSCFCSCVCALGEISINVVDLFADIGILVGAVAPRVALRCIGTIFTNIFYYIYICTRRLELVLFFPPFSFTPQSVNDCIIIVLYYTGPVTNCFKGCINDQHV